MSARIRRFFVARRASPRPDMPIFGAAKAASPPYDPPAARDDGAVLRAFEQAVAAFSRLPALPLGEGVLIPVPEVPPPDTS